MQVDSISTIGQAVSWICNPIQKVGIAFHCKAFQQALPYLLVSIINIKRNPLNRRNFETFSEDPFLTGKMTTASTKGVQSEHIGAIINGITANNQQAN
jgi:beta-glucosidase|tara:strand:+ start:422 stop:715 length:294 start_codon:yes stop_codon:yes gene_type:complete